MIYTVTLNPAIDNVIQTEAFQKGHINRACREYIFPGGKGVNVSLVLERLFCSWTEGLPESTRR